MDNKKLRENLWFCVMFLAWLTAFFYGCYSYGKNHQPPPRDKGWVEIFDDVEDSLYVND